MFLLLSIALAVLREHILIKYVLLVPLNKASAICINIKMKQRNIYHVCLICMVFNAALLIGTAH